MKKALAVLLALTLILSAVTFASAELTSFPSDIMDGLGWSASDWTNDETGAAAFIVLSVLSLCGHDGYTANDFDMTGGAFVFLSDGAIVAGGAGLTSGKAIHFYYTPVLKKASYSVSESNYSEATVKAVVSGLKGNSKYSNVRYVSFSKLMEILQLLAGD